LAGFAYWSRICELGIFFCSFFFINY
jgi:hypothetical protein